MMFWMMFVKQASLLYRQFVQNEAIKNFNSAIHAAETAVKVIFSDHSNLADLAICLCNLSVFLNIQFENAKVINDFNYVINII